MQYLKSPSKITTLQTARQEDFSDYMLLKMILNVWMNALHDTRFSIIKFDIIQIKILL